MRQGAVSPKNDVNIRLLEVLKKAADRKLDVEFSETKLLETVNELLLKNADINYYTDGVYRKETAWSIAIKYGLLGIIKLFASKRLLKFVKPLTRFPYHNPLSLAVAYDQLEIVMFLFESCNLGDSTANLYHAYRIDEYEYSIPLIHYTFDKYSTHDKKFKKDVFEYLLTIGASAKQKTHGSGSLLDKIHGSLGVDSKKNQDTFEILNFVFMSEETSIHPMEFAILKKDLDLLEYFSENDRLANFPNFYPLHFVVSNRFWEMVRPILAGKYVNVNQKDGANKTALQISILKYCMGIEARAVVDQIFAVIYELLRVKADPNIELTPYYAVFMFEDDSLINLLIHHGLKFANPLSIPKSKFIKRIINKKKAMTLLSLIENNSLDKNAKLKYYKSDYVQTMASYALGHCPYIAKMLFIKVGAASQMLTPKKISKANALLINYSRALALTEYFVKLSLEYDGKLHLFFREILPLVASFLFDFNDGASERFVKVFEEGAPRIVALKLFDNVDERIDAKREALDRAVVALRATTKKCSTESFLIPEAAPRILDLLDIKYTTKAYFKLCIETSITILQDIEQVLSIMLLSLKEPLSEENINKLKCKLRCLSKTVKKVDDKHQSYIQKQFLFRTFRKQIEICNETNLFISEARHWLARNHQSASPQTVSTNAAATS